MILADWLVVAAAWAVSTLGPTDLGAAAGSSGRPRECAARARGGITFRPTIWQLAREPEIGRYCDWVALAHAQLASRPAEAKAAAIQADALLPNRAAPAVVLARVALAEGNLDEAARAFDRAFALDPRAVDDPASLHDLGSVLRRTGRLGEALLAYRALAPRVELLGSDDRATRVLLEAAHVAVADARRAATPAVVSARLEEAIAYLREARHRPPTRLFGDVLLSLGLLFDRVGDRTQADAALVEARRVHAHPAETIDYLTLEEDRSAIEALLLERVDRTRAARAWRRHLDGPGAGAPWADASRRRADEAGRGQVDKGPSATGRSRSRDKRSRR